MHTLVIPLVFAVTGFEDQASATRSVIRAVVLRAKQLEQKRPSGDDLTGEYVRAAAKSALLHGESVRASAFLMGLGVALDDTAMLRTNPLTARTIGPVETDAERSLRLRVLGQPTLRGRRDLCLHFAASLLLTEVIGPAAAESAGIAKEMLDMTRTGGTGFSFADLAANLAGISFADRVRGDPKFIGNISESFDANDLLSSVEGLPEGITAQDFAKRYGSADDPRFRAALAEVRKRLTGAKANPR